MGSRDRASPRRLAAIASSPTVVYRELAASVQAGGRDVLDLTVGEPNFDTPAHIRQSAVDALDSGFTHYVHSRGIPELRQAISRKLREDTGLEYDSEAEILVTMGGKQAIFAAVMATIDDGEEVLILDPCWVSYDPIVRLAGGTPVHVPLAGEDNFVVTFDRVRPYLSPRTRMMIVNSPNNPTGRVATVGELKAVAAIAEQEDLLVISDEIYERIVYDETRHVSVASLPRMRDRTLVANGFSKAYAMTGWRLGFLAGPADIMEAVVRVYQHSVTCATSFGQRAAVAALEGPQDDLKSMVEEFEARRDLVVAYLDQIPGLKHTPIEGTFYAFPEISAFGSSTSIARILLQEGGVATVPGIAFGAEYDGFLRLSFSVSADRLELALSNMKRVLGNIPISNWTSHLQGG